MSEEKVRLSGEASRPGASADGPVLPTVNPDVEKTAPAKEVGLPAFLYVV
jgi:hypothetical protein